MAPFTRPELPAGPLNDLLMDLHELHLLAGYPSSRMMATAIASSSHTRIHKLFVEPRRPDWGLLELVVEYLAERAHRDTASTRRHFYDRWVAVARASHADAGGPRLTGTALPTATGTSASASTPFVAPPAPETLREEGAEHQPAENVDVLLSRAKTASPEEAEEIYQHLISRGSSMGYMTYGNWQAKRGNLVEAERLLRAAAGMGNKHAPVSLGRVLEKQERFDEARTCYEEFLRSGERNAAVVLAKFHEKRGNRSEAEKAYLAALEQGDETARVPLAKLYEKMGKTESAERMYLAAIQREDGGAVGLLARLYARSGDLRRQEQVLEDYITSSAVTPSGLPVILGKIRERQGRVEEALELYRMAVTLGSAAASGEIERLERAAE